MLEEELKRFHNPNAEKTRKLFTDCLGTDVTVGWKWSNYDSAKAASRGRASARLYCEQSRDRSQYVRNQSASSALILSLASTRISSAVRYPSPSASSLPNTFCEPSAYSLAVSAPS
jgi:hypothetical protein